MNRAGRSVLTNALIFSASQAVLLALAPLCAGQSLVINEIHYHPYLKTELSEFIELYNAGTNRADLGGWHFSAGIAYTFPENTFLDAGAYIVVAEDPATIDSVFGVPALGPYDGQMSNDGEAVVLRNAAGGREDEVDYNTRFPWPISADGEGPSMELVHPSLDNDLAGSWRCSGYPGQGDPTPGRQNSAWTLNAPPQVRQVEHNPQQPASGQPVAVTAKITDPDGVGEVTLHYQVVPPGAYMPAFLPLDRGTLRNSPQTPLPPNPDFEDAANWADMVMSDDGSGPDAVAGDHVYTGVLPGQVHRTLLRYRITVTDTAGAEATAPYADDPSLNFACFFYDGVPPYEARRRSVHPEGPGHVYGTNVMTSLPVYFLIARVGDIEDCVAYDPAYEIVQSNEDARDKFNWEGAFVYEGTVYDHVRFRLRQAGDRYGGEGKRAWRIRFRRGRYLEARDNYGEKYPYPWRILNIGKMFDLRRVGNFGLAETMNNELWNMSGVPAPWMHRFHFRVVDGFDEAPSGPDGQYYGDFWGMFLGMEDYDAQFLDTHSMADGNLYKLKQGIVDGNELKHNQGRLSVADDSDFQNILGNLNPQRSDGWLRTHVNYDRWYRYHAVCEGVRHYDFRYSGTYKNRAWYFEPSSNLYGRLWVLPHDSDASWGPSWNSGEDFPWYAIFRDGGKPAFKQEYRNVIREFRDLVWTEEVVCGMIDDLEAFVADFSMADRDRWKDAPTDAGYQDYGPVPIEDKVQDMKDFAFVGWTADHGEGEPVPAGGRAAHLDSLADREGDRDGIPDTPVVTSTSPSGFPANALTFETTPFSDPQGDHTFAAMKWRVGEISDTNSPSYRPSERKKYEVPAVWESEDLTNFVASVTIPSVAVKVGHTYRVRSRMKDTSGRWSHWSAPVQLTVSEPENIDLLVDHLRISELMYNPAADQESEFVELYNTSSNHTVNLDGVRFTDGIDFWFDGGLSIPPMGYLLVVGSGPAQDFAAFRQHYGLAAGVPIAGPYQGRLDNGGEKLTLKTAWAGTVISSFDYDDGRGWPQAADGVGHSLVPLVIHSQTNEVLSYGRNWRRSAFLGGSPGRADLEPVPTVVLNEIMAHTDYTNEAFPAYDSDDWIELYNASESAVTLTNWYLSDDGSDLRKWAIPATTVIPAHSRIVFDEVTGFHSPITEGFGLDKAGEQVFLSLLPGVGSNRVADCVRFKGQEKQYSLGRYPDGDEYWQALAPTPDAANTPPGLHVVIDEIMYHPRPTAAHPEDNTNEEYVELHNPTGARVDLWNESGTWRIDGGVSYSFPANTWIPPDGRIVLVSFDPSVPAALNAFLDAYDLAGGDAVIMGPYSGRLSNRGERIAVERPQSSDNPALPEEISWVIVDEAIYFDQRPWPTASDGTGRPLQRRPGTSCGNDPANWSGLDATPGTPAAKVAIVHPQDGARFISPFSVEITAEIDHDRVSGSVHRVELLEDTNSLRVTYGAPYSCIFTGETAEWSYTFSAVLVDDAGAYTSREVVVYGSRPPSVDNDGGASNVTATSATLNGSISGGGDVQVRVCWGTADGGTNIATWSDSVSLGVPADGLFSADVEGLTPGTEYYYRCLATGSGREYWANSSAGFTTRAGVFWDWSYRMSITFDGYEGSETLVNFPALVVLGTNLGGLSYTQFESDTGADLRFADSNEVLELSYELDEWRTNGVSYVWVRVPEISGTNSRIWAFWGNDEAADRAPAYASDGSTWSEGFAAVLHLGEEGAGTRYDSTRNNNDGTPLSYDGDEAAPGMIGGADDLDGSGDSIRADHDSTLTMGDALTVSAWIKADAWSSPVAEDVIIRKSSGYRFMNRIDAGENMTLKLESSTDMVVEDPISNYGVGEWHHVAGTYDRTAGGDNVRLYHNGVLVASDSGANRINPGTDDVFVGSKDGTEQYFNGIMDEVRICHAARSPDWIRACWMNQVSNSGFTSYGAVGCNLTSVDADGDGMADGWEDRYFGGTNVVNGGAYEDWDRDGFPNLFEWIAGTDPTDNTSFLSVSILQFGEDTVVYYEALEAGAPFYAGKDRFYDLEDRSDMAGGAWNAVPGHTDTRGEDSTVQYTNPPSPSVRFFRVKTRLR
ncbi:DUF2341 domain-containing protein [Verrucomicrobiota bacterium]